MDDFRPLDVGFSGRGCAIVEGDLGHDGHDGGRLLHQPGLLFDGFSSGTQSFLPVGSERRLWRRRQLLLALAANRDFDDVVGVEKPSGGNGNGAVLVIGRRRRRWCRAGGSASDDRTRSGGGGGGCGGHG